MLLDQIFGAAAGVLTLAAFYPYLRGILRGTAKPHVFTWITWGGTTLVVFFAQLQAGAGIGAWPIGLSGAITLLIAVLAYGKRADITITAADWLFFAAAATSLPLWYLTADPTWAVVVLTAVDLLGFGPTVRKAGQAPHSEPLAFFALLAVRNGLVLLALERYSLATVLFPAAVAAACVLFILFVLHKRREGLAPAPIPEQP